MLLLMKLLREVSYYVPFLSNKHLNQESTFSASSHKQLVYEGFKPCLEGFKNQHSFCPSRSDAGTSLVV